MFRKLYLPIAALLTLGFAGILLVSGCGGGDTAEAEEATEAAPALTVRVETATPRSISDVIQVAGILKAFDDVMITPEEGGTVREWVVDKGERVAKGQTIVRLKDDVIRAQYEAANAQYKMAQLNLERQTKVYEDRGISELQYKNLEFARDGAKANAELMKARLDRTVIKSPVDGVLEQQFVDDGEFAPPGMPIAHVVSTDRLKVQAEIPEKYAGSVRVGAGATLTFDAYPGDTVRANVSYVSATVNASNRTLTSEIVIPSRGGKYKPEMIARTRILREAKEDALVVSENVVLLVDMNKYVLFVEQNGTAVERVVGIGSRQNSHVEILSGLQPGDRVIVTGVQKLADGLRVSVVE